MRKRWARVSLLSIFTASLLSGVAVAGDATWVEVRSPHFSVFTDAGERRGREVATRFEQMRAVFGQLLTQANVNTPIPLEIVAFRNAKELRQVSPLWNGKPVELGGLFMAGSDRCFILLDMALEDPWRVVFHEYAHQLMNGTLSSDLDPWFVEGFAEYFSSIEVDSHHASVGKIPAATYEIVRQQGMMKIADLFRVQHDSATYNESGDKRTVFYAESSMVVHYLYDNQLLPKLAVYFELKHTKNVPVEEAIQQAFGMDAAKFHKQIVEYVASNQYRYHQMNTPPDIETKGYTILPVSSADAAALVADIHAHSRDYQDKAVSEFEAVLKADPNNAAACRGMGYAYLQKRDFDQAGEYFQRAAKLDSKDSRVHYYSGVLMNLRSSASQAELAAVTEELKTAIALDPDFADAYMQLAFTQRRTGDLSGAMENAKKAISLNPRNQSYYFNVADLYVQQRKFPDAESLYRALAKSSDPLIASRASIALTQIEQIEAAMKQAEAEQRADSSEERPATAQMAPGLARRAAASDGGQPPTVHITPGPAPREEAPAEDKPPATAPVKFLKGTILSVDCTSAPEALLTVVSSGKRWLMQVRDSHHVLVLGAGGFSCNWSGQKAALNYRQTGESAGSVVSIEIQ